MARVLTVKEISKDDARTFLRDRGVDMNDLGDEEGLLNRPDNAVEARLSHIGYAVYAKCYNAFFEIGNITLECVIPDEFAIRFLNSCLPSPNDHPATPPVPDTPSQNLGHGE